MSAPAKTAANPTKSVFLTSSLAKDCINVAGGSPVYAYSLEKLEQAADSCLAFPNAFGLTVRYAMKACPNAAILKFFSSKGIHIDASSGYEVRRCMAAGVPAENISLSSQELPKDFAELMDMGVKVNAW
jgi:diaminopimelate decarboxylase